MKNKLTLLLIILVVILFGIFWYVPSINKKSAQDLPSAQKIQNTQITATTKNSSNPQYPEMPAPSKNLLGVETIAFPSFCNFTKKPAQDPTIKTENWSIDCGVTTNNDARGFMGKILESQGWKFCDGQIATATWWKKGVMVRVMESQAGHNSTSYPFEITLYNNQECK
jgi:hypothetical protein